MDQEKDPLRIKVQTEYELSVEWWCGDEVKIDYRRVGPVMLLFSSIQSLSRVQLFAIPWTAVHHVSLCITNSWSLLKLMSIESVMSSFVVPFCACLQSFPASGSFQMSQFFASAGQSIGVSASASSFHWVFRTVLISFRIDWLDLLAVQGTLKNSSRTLQLKSVNSLALSFLYSPSLTFIHNYGKKT